MQPLILHAAQTLVPALSCIIIPVISIMPTHTNAVQYMNHPLHYGAVSFLLPLDAAS